MANTTTLNEATRSPVDGTEFIRLATPGANWKAQIRAMLKPRFTVDTTFFVRVTGSDSNGGTNSSTDAWATLQHAANFLTSNYDFAGFRSTVDIGAGIFVGVTVPSATGGGHMFFKGAGSVSTTITDSSDGNGCVSFNNPSNTIIEVDKVTISPTSFAGCYLGVAGGTFVVGDPAFASSDLIFTAVGSSNDCIFVGAPSILYISAAGNQIKGAWANCFEVGDSGVVKDFGGMTMVSTPSFATAFALVYSGGDLDGNSYTGAATGPRFNLTHAANASVTGLFPGNAAGVIDQSSSLNGVVGSNDNYQVPVNGFSITLNTTDTQLILDPAGALAAGTVTMQPSPVDGQSVDIRTSQTITTLTISPNAGQTIAGYVAGTLASGGRLNAVFKASNLTWYF